MPTAMSPRCARARSSPRTANSPEPGLVGWCGASAEGMSQLTITGPVTGGAHGWPFGRALVDLDTYGYVEEEWFLDGTATAYAVEGEMTRDGRWSVSPT